MSFELNPFTHLGKEWEELTRRVTELENRLDVLVTRQQPPAVHSPQAPAPQAPAPQVPAPGPYAPQTPTTPPQATPGPQAVPSFQQLLERGMQVSEAKGDKTCIDLIAKYGGKDGQGTVKISLVPQDKYAALFADFGAQLGLH